MVDSERYFRSEKLFSYKFNVKVYTAPQIVIHKKQ